MRGNGVAVVAAVVACGLIALSAVWASPGDAQPQPPQPRPPAGQIEGVTVVGEGVVLVQPNVARVTLGVEVSEPSLASAQADAARRMDAVVQGLKALGVPDSDIRTVSFSVTPRYDTQGNQQGALRGYQVQNLVEVKVSDISGLGRLIDDAIAAGATRVVGIRFEAEGMDRAGEQARTEAMRDARTKAEQLAGGVGVALGGPTVIEELESGGVTPLRAEGAPAAAAAPQTPIQPGELQVRVRVRVVWAIQ
jgi:uncharacterized protein